MDFAKRAHDHSFHIDPIVRSLLDTDFYKLLMQQHIFLNHPDAKVTFKVTNRTRKVRLADEIDIDELRRQLDYARTLPFEPSELIWMTGQTFYGQQGIFKKEYIDYLRTYRLPEYTLSVDQKSGQITLRSKASWADVTLWEIVFLTIVNEMRYRKKLQKMSKSQLDIMYARAKVKLYAKLEKLKTLPNLSLSDFGTRRRHSFLWQEYAVLTAVEVLGDKFIGTSNCLIAMRHGLDAKGTNAHEMPMVLAALAKNDGELKAAQYKVCEEWQKTYNGNLLVFLPDTFGTTQFLANAPSWMDSWVGARPDSKKALPTVGVSLPGGDELIQFWNGRGQDATQKLIIFSDGLDVRLPGFEVQGEDILDIYDYYDGRVKMGFGFGTMLTNDFLGCHPLDADEMMPISLVCKVEAVEVEMAFNNEMPISNTASVISKVMIDKPCIKLSDNQMKATGDKEEVKRYISVFGSVGVISAETIV